MKRFILLCFIFSFALPFLAQEENEDPEPFTREDNECYEGGTMEGSCNQDTDGDGIVNQAEIDWAWNCGWYMARYNDGEFSRGEVPYWCAILLPPLSTSAQASETLCVYMTTATEEWKFCITGNYLTTDVGNNGSIDLRSRVIADNSVLFGVGCLTVTSHWTDVGLFHEPMRSLLLSLGFSATDNICHV